MESILKVEGLKKHFKTAKGIVKAVDDVSFEVGRGKTIGVVGESGCGKSTLGRAIVNLIPPTSGEVWFKGKNIGGSRGQLLSDLHKAIQMIFQDPYSSLDPRMTVSELIAEPLVVYRAFSTREGLDGRVRALMEVVGLSPRLENSLPHELDGGRRQRIGIARALALEPELIVCDEPVSSLDVSIQAQILNLMRDLQHTKEITYLFITHDLSVVRYISDTIIVMYLGRIMERCPTEKLFKRQFHPYTQALLSAVFVAKVGIQRSRIILQGEIPSPIGTGGSCRFAGRCNYVQQACREKEPELEEIEEGHFVACFRARELARANGWGA